MTCVKQSRNCSRQKGKGKMLYDESRGGSLDTEMDSGSSIHMRETASFIINDKPAADSLDRLELAKRLAMQVVLTKHEKQR